MYYFRRFLRGHNFLPWFRRRRAVAEQQQVRLWMQARMKTSIHQFLSKMSELEIVDSFNAIERHLLGQLQVCAFWQSRLHLFLNVPTIILSTFLPALVHLVN